jgi:putative selenium metabolism protein SsnA
MFIVGNGIVVTRDERNTVISDGAVCMKENRIMDVGNRLDMLKSYPEAEFIDARGGVIMPGFINAHNHIYSAFARGLSIPGNNPSNFLEILEGTWWRLDRKLTLKQVYLSAISIYLDCIKNGVTTVFDHHASYGKIEESLFQIGEAAREAGVRTCLSYEISDRDGKDKMLVALKENLDFATVCKKESKGMQKAMIGMHASFTLSDETLKYCIDKNRDNIGYHIHVAEGFSDAMHCQETYGMSVVRRLADRGILGRNTIAGHCVHINESDMELLKETDTMVVHNPESNMGNAVGCPKVLDMYERGILIGLGTDGYTNDMLESMKVANILHKHETKNPSAAWGEIPNMLFVNNRHIAKRIFGDVTGVLAKGALADIIVMEYNPLTPMDENNINSHILFGMNGKHTVTTIINGKVLMKDRRLLNLKEEQIHELCREEAAKLWKDICN